MTRTLQVVEGRVAEALAPFGLHLEGSEDFGAVFRTIHLGADVAGFAILHPSQLMLVLTDTGPIGLKDYVHITLAASISAARLFEEITERLVVRLRPRTRRPIAHHGVPQRLMFCPNLRATHTNRVTIHSRTRHTATTNTWACEECGHEFRAPRSARAAPA